MTFQVRFARGLAAAALALVPWTMPAADAATTGHVYAAGPGGVLRFAIVNGVPAKKPDLAIGNASGPIAVSPAGAADTTLYAMQNGSGNIVAFADAATKPIRSIVLPNAGQGAFYAVADMAVDRAGYLYVAVYLNVFARGARRLGVRYPSPGGVVVYAPNASGHARPVAAVPVYPEAIALDAKDDLFICGQDTRLNGFCNEYRDARTHPALVSSFKGPTLNTILGATVAGSEIYVSAQDPTNRYDFTAQVFATSSHGVTAPQREIFPTSGSVTGKLATNAGILYASDGSFQLGGVWEFAAKATGSQPALGSVARFTGGASGVAVGR